MATKAANGNGTKLVGLVFTVLFALLLHSVWLGFWGGATTTKIEFNTDQTQKNEVKIIELGVRVLELEKQRNPP